MPLTLIIKGTRKCNLRCSYCHDWRAKGKPISFRRLARLIKLAQNTDREVTYVWHGGEPLTLGKHWYEKVLLLQDLARKENSFVRNSLQTNATLLDEEWCMFFKKHSFYLGVSIDGPEELHNKTRYDIKSEGTYHNVLAGIDLLKKYEIPFGLLLVVTNDIVSFGAGNIYNWLKEINAPSIAFLPQRPDTTNLSSIREPSISSNLLSREVYANFLFDLLQFWWVDKENAPRIRELETLVEGIINGRPSLCVYAGSCVGKYFGVEPNGSIYHCDRYIPDEKYIIGHIDDPQFMFANPLVESIKTKVKAQEEEIEKSCQWYEVCHGGCPHDRQIDPVGYLGRDKCCGMKELIDDIFTKVNESVLVNT